MKTKIKPELHKKEIKTADGETKLFLFSHLG